MTTTAAELSLGQELHHRLLEQIRSIEADGLTEVEKKGYIRVNVGDHTLVYLHTPTRSGVRVHVTREAPGYDVIQVSARGEIPKAVSAVKRRVKALA